MNDIDIDSLKNNDKNPEGTGGMPATDAILIIPLSRGFHCRRIRGGALTLSEAAVATAASAVRYVREELDLSRVGELEAQSARLRRRMQRLLAAPLPEDVPPDEDPAPRYVS